MDVQHRNTFEYDRRKQTPVRDDDAALHVHVVEVTHAVSNGETELERARLHGTRRQLAPPTTFAVGSSYDDGDLVTRSHESSQRRYGRLGRAEEGETHLLTQQQM